MPTIANKNKQTNKKKKRGEILKHHEIHLDWVELGTKENRLLQILLVTASGVFRNDGQRGQKGNEST